MRKAGLPTRTSPKVWYAMKPVRTEATRKSGIQGLGELKDLTTCLRVKFWVFQRLLETRRNAPCLKERHGWRDFEVDSTTHLKMAEENI